MFWFNQVADITPELAAKANTMEMVKEAGMWTSYVLAAVGSTLLLIGIMMAVRNFEDLEDFESDESPILNHREEGVITQQPEVNEETHTEKN